jgi:hypothetical protein
MRVRLCTPAPSDVTGSNTCISTYILVTLPVASAVQHGTNQHACSSSVSTSAQRCVHELSANTLLRCMDLRIGRAMCAARPLPTNETRCLSVSLHQPGVQTHLASCSTSHIEIRCGGRQGPHTS